MIAEISIAFWRITILEQNGGHSAQFWGCGEGRSLTERGVEITVGLGFVPPSETG